MQLMTEEREDREEKSEVRPEKRAWKKIAKIAETKAYMIYYFNSILCLIVKTAI